MGDEPNRRYVELEVISYGSYMSFNSNHTGGAAGSTCRPKDFVNEDNAGRAILMRGCPWKITVEQVEGFFGSDFGSVTQDNIHIEEFNGKRTGSVLVFFENQQNAQDAKEGRQKGTIGEEQRYVELFDENDEFFRKVCKMDM